MRAWLRLSRWIDRLNLALGRLVAWLALLMIAIGAYNALARYLGRFIGFNLSSNAYLELQQYLFSALVLLAAAAVLAKDEHVRVDVLYNLQPYDSSPVSLTEITIPNMLQCPSCPILHIRLRTFFLSRM